jgi:heat shock protein HtpX
MVMNFWEEQRRARKATVQYVCIFIVLTLAAATLAEVAMRTFARDHYHPNFPVMGLAFLTITLLVAAFNYMRYSGYGGSYVAESMNGRLVEPYTSHPKERQLMNIVEEIAVATSLPMPPVYIIDANEINAFAAGTKPDNAAIAVTQGTLNQLNRDELQGVIAHEFGHIYNADMKIGMRLAAMIMGFFIASYLGLRLLQGASYGSRRENGRRGGNPILAAALILLAVGAVTWFFGSLLQSMVSRKRELLADASAIQYTRNPQGLANALRKIAAMGDRSDMPKSGKPFAHLYFNEHESMWAKLFATHPPIKERIAIIEGRQQDL